MNTRDDLTVKSTLFFWSCSMLATLAQAYSSSPSSGDEAAAIIVMLVFLMVILLIVLAISVAICLMLFVIQSRVPVEHQKISPIAIWLILIPLFGLVWNFFVFQRIPESYKSYFDSIGDASVGDCGKSIGLWYAISTACCFVPCVNYIAGPASLVLLIIFLVKGFGLRGKISAAV
jgi:hypothetical protein